MRNRLFITGSLIAMLAATPALRTLAQVAPPNVPPVGRRMQRERHPALRQALMALQRANTALQKASRDFGGHRTKAQQLTQQAIQEVQAAIKFDQR